MGLYRKVLHAIDNHGIRGIFLRVIGRLRGQSGPQFNESQEPHPFDRLHGTDTGGMIPGDRLGANTSSDLYNTAYYGISPSTLTRALELLPESPAAFTFVDLGCGKGRALVVAAQLPFQQVLGVELSAELCVVARSNAARYPQIVVQQHDAATVIYPDTPLVIYLYHPFLKPVLRRVLGNLEQQRRNNPHPTYLLYANCRYEDEMARFPFLKPFWDHSIPLSPEDFAADRHGTTAERYTLYQATA